LGRANEGLRSADYVFSSTYKPGKFKLQLKHISNKWKLYVKEELNIEVDLYALKHLNLDETSSILNAQKAARMAGHSSPVITMKHYLVNEKEREREKLKKLIIGLRETRLSPKNNFFVFWLTFIIFVLQTI
jgi:integrase